MKKVKFRNPFTEKKKGEFTVTCKSVGLVQQHERDGCNINKIMERYQKTGVLTDNQLQRLKPIYGDFSGFGDLMEIQQRMREADDAMMMLPARVRQRFDHSAPKLIEFLKSTDPADIEESMVLGLRKRPKKEERKEEGLQEV